MAKKIKYDKDGWAEDPLELIKQLNKEINSYAKAGGKPTKKMISNLNKVDKQFEKMDKLINKKIGKK